VDRSWWTSLRTDNPRIWAAGDVTGHPQFVYVAGAHGALVADNAFDGAGRTVGYHHLPRVTFGPSIAAGAGGHVRPVGVARGLPGE
jgi:mercuric reductase